MYSESVVRVDEVHVLGVVGDGEDGTECGGDGVGREARGNVSQVEKGVGGFQG